MLRRFKFVAALALAATLLMLGSPSGLAAVIKGSATYRERIALPASAIFEATLEDVSRTDRPAVVLGRARLEPADQPPFRFEIQYDATQVAPSRRYALRARITDGGKLLFAGERRESALPAQGETDVALLLRPASRPPRAALGPLPASFAGTLPCADCPGVKWHVDLLADGTYFSRMTYHERQPEAGWDEIGRWAIAGQPPLLKLFGGGDTETFEIESPNRLRKLDMEGQPIASSFNYELKRLPSFAPIEARLRLTGTYTQQATDGFITPCATGRRLPVAAEAENAALEAAYRKIPPANSLLADVEARIVHRPGKTAKSILPTLVVERFFSLQPDRTCEPRSPEMGLLGLTGG
jgi:copper homeostasis protein (lipoprotein)